MLYDIDSFGFVPGFIKKGLRLMSEEDLKVDKKLRIELAESKYQVWKRRNIIELKGSYEWINPKSKGGFERFCRNRFNTL